MAFGEGFAHRWQTPFQGGGPRKNRRTQHLGNKFGVTDEDTESDSSMSTFPSQPSTRRGTTTAHNDSISRKTMVEGTIHPIFKKDLIIRTPGLLITHYVKVLLLITSDNGVGNMSQTKYMGPTAIQALQILNTQSQMQNISSASHIPNTADTPLTSTQLSPRPVNTTSQPNALNSQFFTQFAPCCSVTNVQETKHT